MNNTQLNNIREPSPMERLSNSLCIILFMLAFAISVCAIAGKLHRIYYPENVEKTVEIGKTTCNTSPVKQNH